MIDFKLVASNLLGRAEDFVSLWLPGGKRSGHEWLCGDLRGNAGESLSVNLTTGKWADFSGDEKGGDLISLYAAINGLEQLAAAKECAKALGMPDEARAEQPKNTKQQKVAVEFAPEGVPPPSMHHHHYGQPQARWCYKDEQGRVVGWIGRYLKSDGVNKEVWPVSWSRNLTTGEEKWSFLSFPKPRPLYGLPELIAAKPDARVYVVEGEKCADALRDLGAVVVTWPGGGKAVAHANWTPLKGRKITIWPDRDRKTYTERETKDAALVGTEKPAEKQPGYKAAMDIAKILSGLECTDIKIVNPPDGKADGWDVADAIAEGWTTPQIVDLLKNASVYTPPAEPVKKAPVVIPTLPNLDPVQAPPTTENAAPPERKNNWPFRILGHDQGDFFYLSHASRQIVTLSAKGHNKAELLQLAPLDWWNEMFPGNEDAQPNWLFAANALIQQSMKKIFDPADVRGRGAWLDNGRVVYHAGSELLVKNKFVGLDRFESDYVYQRGKKIKVEVAAIASQKEAHGLLQLCRCLNLKNPIDHILLAGWLVCAPICGVLDWRPHLWLTGASGTGKSWLLEHIMQKILGNMALYVQSNTTEAGIRQTLGCDALPVMFDEAETENQKDLARLQQTLILARQASRDTGGRIVKGTAGGNAQSFYIRSCFCFSSIGVAATQRADMSRITILELFKRTNQEEALLQWDTLVAHWENTAARPEWCAAIRARSIDLAETIAANAHVFATACARHLGTQRDGDQIGALLAGAWSLTSSDLVTFEKASEWCNKQNWSAFSHAEQDKDEHRCFAVLMSAIIQTEEEGRNVRVSIAELVAKVLNFAESGRGVARDTLERYGIGVRKNRVDVSDTHTELKRIFADTPFAGKWGDQLKRISGAGPIKTSHFHNVQSRATGLPLELFEPHREDA